MAKNLKLNIKNTQLAEALKLGQPKKGLLKKEKPAQAEEVSEPKLPLPEPVVEETKEVAPPPPAPVEEVAPQAPVVSQAVQEEEPKVTPPAPPAKRILPGFVKREPYSGHRPAPRGPSDRPYPPRREGGPMQGPRGESSAPYQRREGSAPYPRTEGSAPYQRRDGSAPYPRTEGSAPYQRREGSAPYPRTEGSAPYQRREGSAPYPRREGSAPYPRRDMAGPRPPMRRDGGDSRPDRSRPLPPVREPGKELPQQQQQHKKQSVHAATERDPKAQKKLDYERSFDARDRQGLRTGDDELWRKKKIHKTKPQAIDETSRPKELLVRLPITVKDLAAEMKLKASQLIAKLFMQGVIITLNDYLDDETTVQLLGHEFECDIKIDTKEEERIRITDKTIKDEVGQTDPSLLKLRPPVVAFMGHVDHGKTSLIDAIRRSNVAATESGAITQHIGAFTCHTQVGMITILDTPGHEAFSSMRERGADVTDIVVLVIAGDEGIRTQTLEAMEQAKQASVPIVVAINKCDKPNFDADSVYRQLAERNLLPEAWGGSVITVNCSALTGEGIKDLLEMLALQAEVLELRADPSARARGTVIESELHKGMGPVATILVQNGTLHVGDALVFGQLYARVKTMHNEHDEELTEAPPSTPVKITGLSGLPSAGSEFIVVKSEKEAKEIAETRREEHKLSLQQAKKVSMENFLQNKADSSEKKILNLILKADVQGSLEALKNSLRKLPSKKVDIHFVVEGVGEISESDIQYAAASKATVIGFHTAVESHAEPLIKQTKTDVRLHEIIYHAVDDVKEIMLNLLDKIAKENEIGEAVVKTVFKSSQIGNIAGCQVVDGTIRRNAHARLIRDKALVWKGPIASLKRNKEDVKEVQKGLECGIVLQGFSDVKEGDLIQVYEILYLQQELE